MYGYENTEVKQSSYHFGLNTGNTFLTKFAWIPNGGKDGAEQEALEIIFNINGTEKSYRQFPVTKAFLKDNGGETTDPNSDEMKEASRLFNQKISSILECFVPTDSIKAAMSNGFSSFKDYCNVCAGLLPTGFDKMPVDIFLQYQWKPTGENTKTYLEIPKDISKGKFVVAAVAAQPDAQGNNASWKEIRDENGIHYKDGAGNTHPIGRTKWFADSPFANQIDETKGALQNSNSGTANTAQPKSNTPAW
jgi:hypothetical protein